MHVTISNSHHAMASMHVASSTIQEERLRTSKPGEQGQAVADSGDRAQFEWQRDVSIAILTPKIVDDIIRLTHLPPCVWVHHEREL